MAGFDLSGGRGKNLESILKPGQDLRDRHVPHLGCRQLNR
jgi:hypothetical protein